MEGLPPTNLTPVVTESLDWLLEQCEAYELKFKKPLLSYNQALGMTADQVIVLHKLCTEDYDAAFLTGPAGTGKSYTVKLLKELLNLQDVYVYRTAATGVAAQLIRGSTVHRFLGLGSFDVVPRGYWEDANCCITGGPRRSVKSAYERSMMNYKVSRPILLVIDEISMLTSEQLVLVYQVAKLAHEEMKSGHPIRFLLVGDLRQLAAVKTGKELFPCHHHYCFEEAEFTLRHRPEQKLYFGSFFGSGPFEKGKPKPDWKFISYGLYHQHRQSGASAAFQEALYYLGRGESLDHPKVSFLKERIYLPAGKGRWGNNQGHLVNPDEDLAEATHLFLRNGNKMKGQQNPWFWQNTVGEHNEKIIERLKKSNARCRTYHAQITPGLWSEEEILDYFKPIPKTITLYEGMRFLCRYNYCNGLANGTMTKIIALYPNSIEVEVIETGECFTLTPTLLPLPDVSGVHAQGYKTLVGRFETCAFGQIGNAMTFWACQGMTLKRKPNARQGEDCLVVHLDKRPRREQGLFYVGCSRVESPEQLYILANSYDHVNQFIYCDPRVLKVMDEAEERTRSLTGECVSEPEVICSIENLWETNAGYGCTFSTTDPRVPKLTLFYDHNDNLLGCSSRADYLAPVEVPHTLIAQCEALLSD